MKDELIICKDCGIEYASDFHEECPSCKRKVHSVGQKVKVIDFDMEFGSMVWFMIKWALASIPAFIILFILMTLLVSIFGVSMVSLFTI